MKALEFIFHSHLFYFSVCGHYDFSLVKDRFTHELMKSLPTADYMVWAQITDRKNISDEMISEDVFTAWV